MTKTRGWFQRPNNEQLLSVEGMSSDNNTQSKHSRNAARHSHTCIIENKHVHTPCNSLQPFQIWEPSDFTSRVIYWRLVGSSEQVTRRLCTLVLVRVTVYTRLWIKLYDIVTFWFEAAKNVAHTNIWMSVNHVLVWLHYLKTFTK